MAPILVLGAGRMGGSLLQGWLSSGAFSAPQLMVCDPHPGAEALLAGNKGAILNPPPEKIRTASTVLLAVKPQLWREVAAAYAPGLAADAAVVSIAAGVKSSDLEQAFGRPVARVMPTTAVAILKGVATIFAKDPDARAAAHALFQPVASVVDVVEESLIDAATAVSGSAPAYFYAFIEALEAAAENIGFDKATAAVLARRTLIGAAALMDKTGEEPGELRRQVTSKGGTTEAALKVLNADPGLSTLILGAAKAALARARSLAG